MRVVVKTEIVGQQGKRQIVRVKHVDIFLNRTEADRVRQAFADAGGADRADEFLMPVQPMNPNTEYIWNANVLDFNYCGFPDLYTEGRRLIDEAVGIANP